jgi:hypothetical protein
MKKNILSFLSFVHLGQNRNTYILYFLCNLKYFYVKCKPFSLGGEWRRGRGPYPPIA